jgi:predicted nucleic acid-binding Zn ribbon protein
LWKHRRQCHENVDNVMKMSTMSWKCQQCHENVDNVMKMSTMSWKCRQCHENVDNVSKMSTMSWKCRQCHENVNILAAGNMDFDIETLYQLWKFTWKRDSGKLRISEHLRNLLTVDVNIWFHGRICIENQTALFSYYPSAQFNQHYIGHHESILDRIFNF